MDHQQTHKTNSVHSVLELHTHGRIICQTGERRLTSIHRFELSPFGSRRIVDMGDVSDELGALDLRWLTKKTYITWIGDNHVEAMYFTSPNLMESLAV